MSKRLVALFVAVVLSMGCAGCSTTANNASKESSDSAGGSEQVTEEKEEDEENDKEEASADTDSDDEVSLSNSQLRETENDISIKDFDLDVSDYIEYGDKTKGFTYKNNSNKTIHRFDLTLKYKEDLSAEEKNEIIGYIDTIMQAYAAMSSELISDSDKEYLELWETSKDKMLDYYMEQNEAEFSIYEDVAPGEVSPTEAVYDYDRYKSTWDLLTPYVAEIEYYVDGTDGDTKCYYYDFATKTGYTE